MEEEPRNIDSGIHHPDDNEQEQEVNFPKFFKTRMESIGQANPNFVWAIQYDLQEVGISDIKKFAPALLFEVGTDLRNQRQELWVEDPNNVDPEFPHHETQNRLNLFLETKNIPRRRHPLDHRGFILEDGKGKQYLVVGADQGWRIQKNTSSTDDYEKAEVEKLLKLLKRYGIAGVIGMMPEGKKQLGMAYGSLPITLIDQDLVGKIREAQWLYSFAEKYKMTNTQYLRFRTLALAAKDAKKSVNYEDPRYPEMKMPTNYDELAQRVILDQALDEGDPFPLRRL